MECRRTTAHPCAKVRSKYSRRQARDLAGGAAAPGGFHGSTQNRGRQRWAVGIDKNRAGVTVQEHAHRRGDTRAEIAIALQQQAEIIRKERPQGAFCAGGCVDGVSGDASISGQFANGRRQVADEAGGECGALLRPQRRGEARLRATGNRRLAENANRNPFHSPPHCLWPASVALIIDAASGSVTSQNPAGDHAGYTTLCVFARISTVGATLRPLAPSIVESTAP